MLDSYETECELAGKDVDGVPLERARGIVGRLTGGPVVRHSARKESEFLDREFTVPNIQKLPIDTQVAPIVEARLHEGPRSAGRRCSSVCDLPVR